MLCREVQSENAILPIWVTELGIWMLCREVQSENAILPIWVIKLGIWMCVSLERQEIRVPSDDTNSPFITLKWGLSDVNRNWGQSQNGFMPIYVTGLEIWMLCRESHSLNASSPICVTELGIWMLCREPQPVNAKSPICVTELGIWILCREPHPANA